MTRRTLTTISAATLGGALNVAVVVHLYARFEYPAFESTGETATLVATAFVLGFVALLVTAHTRLLSPAVGFLAVLTASASAELTSPAPEFGELGGPVVVEGPTHISSYVNTWYVWLALLLFAGVVEFGVRRGYGVGDRRLRNLPGLALSRGVLAWVVFGFAGLVGAATMQLVLRSGIRPPSAALVVFVLATAVSAVPLAALLARGLLVPVTGFALVVPYFLTVEVFVATDSPVHIFLFGPYAVVLGLAWILEQRLRSRLRGWDGGRFAGGRGVD